MEVKGSIPFEGFLFLVVHFVPGWLNWIEHQTSNLGVAGSSPASGVF